MLRMLSLAQAELGISSSLVPVWHTALHVSCLDAGLRSLRHATFAEGFCRYKTVENTSRSRKLSSLPGVGPCIL